MPLGLSGPRSPSVLRRGQLALALLVTLATPAQGRGDPPAGADLRVSWADLGFTGPPVISGRLEDFVRSARVTFPYCRIHKLPEPEEMQRAREALRTLLQGDPPGARLLFRELGFELLELEDPEGKVLLIKEFAGDGARGWGLYAVNLSPRRPLVLEAPHPSHDRYTGEQAARLMLRLGGRALLLATTHRCTATTASRCQGITGACRQIVDMGRYRSSDRAHIVQTIFHALHQELLDGDRSLVAVQLHGFSRRPGRRRHIILSDGTQLPGRHRSISNGLARALRDQLPRKLRRYVKSCNETSRQNFLCGTHNVQGRHANGSRNPCRKAAKRSRNRFLQVEQSLDVRTEGGLWNPGLLLRAMERQWPAQAPDPGAAAAPPGPGPGPAGPWPW